MEAGCDIWTEPKAGNKSLSVGYRITHPLKVGGDVVELVALVQPGPVLLLLALLRDQHLDDRAGVDGLDLVGDDGCVELEFELVVHGR